MMNAKGNEHYGNSMNIQPSKGNTVVIPLILFFLLTLMPPFSVETIFYILVRSGLCDLLNTFPFERNRDLKGV